MVKRERYLKQLEQWRDRQLIKVVTGVRRCGKSTLLEQYRALLLEGGVASEQIVSLNLEALENESLLEYHALYSYLCERLHPTKQTYIFLDEIQLVPEFQKAVDSLYIKPNVDLYITGSNAFLLSGELATLLSGRFIEINMLPLSFSEYCTLKGGSGDAALASYLRTGGMPYILQMDLSEDEAEMYLESIYNTIIVKDIELRQSRQEPDRDRRRVTDLTLLKNIARFLANSIGNPVSVKSISDYLISSGRKISPNTVDDYLSALIDPYVFYPVERFDVTGKKLLRQNRKFYIVDLGLRRRLVARKDYDLGFSLENTVYFELLRRGYSVNVGRIGDAEIDFVARKNERLAYFQVTASMTDPATFEREIAPLRAVKDNYPKTVLTLDRFTPGDVDGIEIINVADWLAE